MTISRPALIEVQRGHVMASTTLTPSQLAKLTSVDIYDPAVENESENGYQRRPSTTRITQAAVFYGEGVEKRQGRELPDHRGLMPNPIVANIRSDDAIGGDRSLESLAPGVEMTFQNDEDRVLISDALSNQGNATAVAVLHLDETTVAWIVDGQHRGGAVAVLSNRGRLNNDFPVPIKIMLGFRRPEEIKQFYYINSQAKSVATDLTAELVQRMAQHDSGEANYLSERKKKGSLLQGAAIYEAMRANNSPWMARVRKPNEKISRDTSIAVSQFINSLAPLQLAQMPRQLSAQDWARVIDAFWEAISRLLPQPFDIHESPGSWVLFKATGVNALHRILADCLPMVIQRGGRLADPEQYEQLLVDLPSLSGFGIDPSSGEESQIDGAEFWRSASIASQFTGRYGTDRLVGMIRGLIAKTTNDIQI